MCTAIMKRVLSGVAESLICTALCSEVYEMQISEAAGGAPEPGAEPCRFPKLEECAHFHYEKVHLPQLKIGLQTVMDQSLYSQHTTNEESTEFHMVQVTSGDECWLVQRSFDNFRMLDDQLHQCIWDRKISQLADLSKISHGNEDLEKILIQYLERFSELADNSINCGPVLNWFQMDNKGHRLLVPSEESRSINTPAVAAAYSVRRYVSQARDELNLEVGDMISVIDMASPGESIWWRGKRGFQVGFFPQHCVHIIGDKVPRNMPLPPPVVGSLAVSPIKPVLRKHGKLIAFFRSFILNRPSRRKLKQSGILKERVFGCDLGEHLLNSGHDIPTVLKCCSEFIEKQGIVDGIYRLSGITSNIQKLRNAFDEDRIPNLHTEDILQDIHSVASLLKMYFRELPNPLCTYQLYQSFVNAVQGVNSSNRTSENDKNRLLKMREAVQKLPPPHYRTLEYLMMHLARVAKFAPRTGMTTRNLAIVWAPNLLRCEELEIGGVAALQGVGVQAVVTEFLICYANLIFCDHLPISEQNSLCVDVSLSPKQTRPKSLAISTPTKLITLEEARSKHMGNKGDDCGYIEVGGGPKNLPKQYHTVIELPHGNRKRNHSKRSPMGWRSFFSKSRNSSQGAISKPRKASTPGIVTTEKSVTESDLTDMKRKLRSVKSAESLTSGHSEPASNELDGLAPLHSLNKPPGHNRSVSHDSYFDTLQNSQNNSEGSLLDLSEIQLNFELEESEMRIFSEDESLVSSPRIPRDKDMGHRRILTRARPEEFSSAANSSNPSPKKQPRVILSPEIMSRKRTRLEDQLSDIQYIDCNTPDNPTVISTTAVVHSMPESFKNANEHDLYQPKNKSPRNSEVEPNSTLYQPEYQQKTNIDTITSIYDTKKSLEADKRQSLNLESNNVVQHNIKKSYTETNIKKNSTGVLTTPTPQSPNYRQLIESSSSGFSPELSPLNETASINSNKPLVDELSKKYDIVVSPTTKKPTTPTYENVLTTISITYKSPSKKQGGIPTEKNKNNIFFGNENEHNLYEDNAKNDTYEDKNIYEDVLVVHTEKAVVPTSVASLPIQEATIPKKIDQTSSQPNLTKNTEILSIPSNVEARPKSLNDLEDYTSPKTALNNDRTSTNAIFDSVSHVNTSMTDKLNSELTICNTESILDSSLTQKAYTNSQNTLSSSRSSDLNHLKFAGHGNVYQVMDNLESPSDFSLSEIVNSSTENLNTSQSSMSLNSPTHNSNSISPNVSPTQLIESPDSSQNNSTASSARINIKDVKSLSKNSLLNEDNHEEESFELLEEEIVKSKHLLEDLDLLKELKNTGLFKENSYTKAKLNKSDSNSEESEEMATSENKSDLTFFNISELASLSDDAKYRNLNVNLNTPNNDLIEFSPMENKDILSASENKDSGNSLENNDILLPVENKDQEGISCDKRKSCESDLDEHSIYQQVKYFRRSIHEVNALLQENSSGSSSEQFHENILEDTNQISNLENTGIKSDFSEDENVYENVSMNFQQEQEVLSELDSLQIAKPDKIQVNNKLDTSNLQFNKSENPVKIILSEKQELRNDFVDLNTKIDSAKNDFCVENDNYDSLEMNNQPFYENCDSATSLDVTEMSMSNIYENVEFPSKVRNDSLKSAPELTEDEKTNSKNLECRNEHLSLEFNNDLPKNSKDSLKKTKLNEDNSSKFKNNSNKPEDNSSKLQESSSGINLSQERLNENLSQLNLNYGQSKLDQLKSNLQLQEKTKSNLDQKSKTSIEQEVININVNKPEVKIQQKDTKDVPDSPNCDNEAKNNVKTLKNHFEQSSKVVQPNKKTPEQKLPTNTQRQPKKTYDKDSLPPCLRARNLKHAVKTRSLDEEEFKREFGINSLQRRKSLDEGMAVKGNTLPKRLNQPKKLPAGDDKLDLHLTHSTENVNLNSSEQKLNRQRIEKYKEERRKFLHDKYRSESFKEDKDVIKSRLKTYTKKEDDLVKKEENVKNESKIPKRACDKVKEVKEPIEDFTHDSLEPIEPDVDLQGNKIGNSAKKIGKTGLNTLEDTAISLSESLQSDASKGSDDKSLNSRESFRMRAAKFEKTTKSPVHLPKTPGKMKNDKIESKKDNCEMLSDINIDFLRGKKKDEEFVKTERRRRTYESARERETEPESFRRTSLESRSPRKEKTSPSYCIKDMKAIFESKSQQ